MSLLQIIHANFKSLNEDERYTVLGEYLLTTMQILSKILICLIADSPQADCTAC